jgi:hypothetical protein
MKHLVAFLLVAYALPLAAQTATSSTATRGADNNFSAAQTAPAWKLDTTNKVLRSGSNALSAADNGKSIYLTTSGSTQSIPTDLPFGFRCSLYNTSAGDITLSIAGGVSVNSSSSSIAIAPKSRLDLTPVGDGGGGVVAFRAVTSREPLSASTIWGRSSTGGASEKTVTDFGFSLLDDVDASAARTTLVLGNIDNTSDANKPVSTAQQTALDGKVSLSGGNTISGAQTLTGQIEMTGQAIQSADSALTASLGAALPVFLRGTQWDVVYGGSPLIYGPTTSANAGFYARQFGLLNSSADIGSTWGTHIVFHTSVTGLGYSCAPTGSANTGHRGAWFTSSCDTPAAAFPNLYPSFGKKVQVSRVRIPTAANRAGRVYQLLTGYTYSGGVEINTGGVKLVVEGSSNTLNCYVCTSYPVTFAAAQTTTGALASPASGTFTAYAVSDSTRDMLIRRTQVGTAITVEIAPYHATAPSWTTVLSMTGGDHAPSFGFSIGPDGSASGAAAAAANAMEIISAWEAVKF